VGISYFFREENEREGWEKNEAKSRPMQRLAGGYYEARYQELKHMELSWWSSTQEGEAVPLRTGRVYLSIPGSWPLRPGEILLDPGDSLYFDRSPTASGPAAEGRRCGGFSEE
jgi:hypothetical protein